MTPIKTLKADIAYTVALHQRAGKLSCKNFSPATVFVLYQLLVN
jgi:hypothetical protein